MTEFSPFLFPDAGETKMLLHIRFKTRCNIYIVAQTLSLVSHSPLRAFGTFVLLLKLWASGAQRMMGTVVLTVVPTSLFCSVAQKTYCLKTVTCTMMSIHWGHHHNHIKDYIVKRFEQLRILIYSRILFLSVLLMSRLPGRRGTLRALWSAATLNSA